MADYTIDSSKFNMGISMLQRIDIILDNIAKATMESDLNSWSEIVFSLYNELRAFMSPTEEESYDNMFFDINALRTKYNTDKRYYAVFYYSLMVFDNSLRKFMNKKDMLLSKKADLSKSVIEMTNG